MLCLYTFLLCGIPYLQFFPLFTSSTRDLPTNIKAGKVPKVACGGNSPKG